MLRCPYHLFQKAIVWPILKKICSERYLVVVDYLISIYFTYIFQVDPNCPHLKSSFNGVQSFVKTEFNALNVLLHQEGITTFQNFILALFERYLYDINQII
jgi:hypothetical protein